MQRAETRLQIQPPAWMALKVRPPRLGGNGLVRTLSSKFRSSSGMREMSTGTLVCCEASSSSVLTLTFADTRQGDRRPYRYSPGTESSGSRTKRVKRSFFVCWSRTQAMIARGTIGDPTCSTTCSPPRSSNLYPRGRRSSLSCEITFGL